MLNCSSFQGARCITSISCLILSCHVWVYWCLLCIMHWWQDGCGKFFISTTGSWMSHEWDSIIWYLNIMVPDKIWSGMYWPAWSGIVQFVFQVDLYGGVNRVNQRFNIGVRYSLKWLYIFDGHAQHAGIRCRWMRMIGVINACICWCIYMCLIVLFGGVVYSGQEGVELSSYIEAGKLYFLIDYQMTRGINFVYGSC